MTLHERYPAGRSLDALVAEKVMGGEPWTVVNGVSP